MNTPLSTLIGKTLFVAFATMGPRPAGANSGGGPPLGMFKEIAFSPQVDCGILTDGSLTCWYRQVSGAVVPMTTAGTFKKLGTFQDDGCGIRTDGTLKCWSRSRPDLIQPPVGVFVDVSVATSFNGTAEVCAVRQSGGLECWGDPTRVLSKLPTPTGVFKQVTVGTSGGACAVAEGGTVKCWANASPPPDRTMVSVSASASYFCGITTAGEIMCWSAFSQMPRGDIPPSHIKFKQIDGSDANYTCGLDIQNRTWCWGTFVLRPLDE